MMKTILQCIMFALLLCIPFAHAQNDEAVELFQRMIFAEQRLNFEGIVQERIIFPPDQVKADVQTAFTHPPSVTPELVLRNFILQISGQDTIAGRGATILELIPKNAISPSWTFWLDEQTGLRLAYEQRDTAGELVARGRLSNITGIRDYPELRDINPPSLSDAQRRRLALLINNGTFSEGFVPVALERSTLGDTDIPAIRITVWDGLNGAVVIIYPRRNAFGEHPYLRSTRVRQITVSVLGPVSGDVLERWAERVSSGPVRRLTANQIRDF